MHFGEILKRLREERGMTQASLADKAGLSKRTVEAWEACYRSPVSPDFFRLVRALGVSCDVFSKIKGDKSSKKKQSKRAK